VGDQQPSYRQTFLDLLEAELRYVDCGHPQFDEEYTIEQPSLGWGAVPVALLRLNAPGYAPALNTGFKSLEERRGVRLPDPTVEVLEN